MKVARLLVGSLTGAFCCALFGAALCWIAAYTNPSSWYLGPIRNWAPVFAIVGALYGLATGFVMGLLIGGMDHAPSFHACLLREWGFVDIVTLTLRSLHHFAEGAVCHLMD
jgi:hypothetical protein